jgi:hypothetical protein
MSARRSSNARRGFGFAACLLPSLALGACADYLSHRDTLTASAGNAPAHTRVVHIADPWPRAAANDRIPGNGQRVDRITRRYLSGAPANDANAPAEASVGAAASTPAGAQPAD